MSATTELLDRTLRRSRLRTVLQSEAAECGLASLAMVLGFHGHAVELRELRRRFPVSMKGASLRRLLDIAAQHGLDGRATRIEIGDLDRLTAPSILHWDMNHFVVLERVRGNRVRIHDPARGVRDMTLAEASDHFSGVAVVLQPNEQFRRLARPRAVPLRALMGPVRGITGGLAPIFVLSLVLQLLAVVAPFHLQWTVDQALVAGDHDLLAVLAGGFALVVLTSTAVGAARTWAIAYLTTSAGVQWSANVLRHLLALPFGWFQNRHLGDIVSRMASVQHILRAVGSGFVEAVIDGLMVAVTFSMMLLYSPTLAAASAIATVVCVVVRLARFGAYRQESEQQLVCAAKQQTHLLETLRGIQTIKLAGCEDVRRHAWRNLAIETASRNLHIARLAAGFTAANTAIFGLERIVVLWLGATLALAGELTVGMLFAYVAYREQFALRIGTLIERLMELRMLRLHAERLADVVAVEPETAAVDIEAEPPARVALAVRDIAFRYADGEPWILSGCSFDVRAGESVAIVGPSGCGKTTLLRVLMGLLEPTAGRIEINGVDSRSAMGRAVRTVSAAVMQDDQLFAGSIADNIAMFEPDAAPADIREAARLAGVLADIDAMPMKFDTLIGDMGAALSGGQRQRIVLARALFRKPKLLFLDEATSNLDVGLERTVNNAIRTLEITRIIVAHRPETIASADRVVTLSAGRVTDAPAAAA